MPTNTYITANKNIDPSHKYNHVEGHEDHPRFYFKDTKGNYIRYTNAPPGHSDNNSSYADAGIHHSEPSIDSNPEYFTPDGRKLSRAPSDGGMVEWNPSYHPKDPKNLWAGRWVNQITGGHEYTYLDSDVRDNPRLIIFRQNVLTDVRLPYLRNYINTLYNSEQIKDQTVSIALALLDQGRFRAQYLCSLTPSDVQVIGPLVRLGTRWIFGDEKFRTAIEILAANTHPTLPLFSIPNVNQDNKVDENISRRIGPHYLYKVLDNQGLSLTGLQTYHATHIFAKEVQRILNTYQVSWSTASTYALEVVASEMGFDLNQEPDKMQAYNIIAELFIDPIVVAALEKNAGDASLLEQEGSSGSMESPGLAVMSVSMNLVSRTPAEEEFSRWCHSLPVHELLDFSDKEESTDIIHEFSDSDNLVNKWESEIANQSPDTNNPFANINPEGI